MFQNNGNKPEFTQIYDRYAVKIFNFIYYKTHHRETAEDLASETFLKALDKFDTFDERKGAVSTWLYRIARNTVIDFYRVKKQTVNIDDVWDLSEENDFASDFDTKEKLKTVKRYLKKLTAEQREIVLLRVWEEMSYREIAEATGKTEANCRMAFSRAVKALKEEVPALAFLMLLFLI